MSKLNLNDYIVRADDGSLDLEQTLEKFETDVVSYDEAQRNGNVKVLAALHTLFDKNPGKSFPMDYLVNQVGITLGANTPEAFADISERVPETVKSNPAVFAQARKVGTSRISDKSAAK